MLWFWSSQFWLVLCFKEKKNHFFFSFCLLLTCQPRKVGAAVGGRNESNRLLMRHWAATQSKFQNHRAGSAFLFTPVLFVSASCCCSCVGGPLSLLEIGKCHPRHRLPPGIWGEGRGAFLFPPLCLQTDGVRQRKKDYLTRAYRRYCLLSLWEMFLLSVAF